MPAGILGLRIEVVFSQYGRVREAHETLDTAHLADVSCHWGDAGSRLLWTLQMFDDRAGQGGKRPSISGVISLPGRHR
jgi:hypothetical protein